ncbi:UNVERIFIED_CONTAM: hypothetical protein Sradi_5722900 [Sesamum radiatum]|uniref:Uncharacterized protein n=1 Tax=Sesamum radiatum TaxID=300843 RepID=A0AAW2L4R5_SESRA
MSLFRALYGRQPPSLIHYLTDATDVATVDDLVSHHRRILSIVKTSPGSCSPADEIFGGWAPTGTLLHRG